MLSAKGGGKDSWSTVVVTLSKQLLDDCIVAMMSQYCGSINDLRTLPRGEMIHCFVSLRRQHIL